MSLSRTIAHPCSSNEPRIYSRSCDGKERLPAKPFTVFSYSIDLYRPKLRIQRFKRRAISDLGVINGHPCFINRRRATISLTFAKSMHPTRLTHLSTLAPGRSSTGMTSEMLRLQDLLPVKLSSLLEQLNGEADPLPVRHRGFRANVARKHSGGTASLDVPGTVAVVTSSSSSSSGPRSDAFLSSSRTIDNLALKALWVSIKTSQ